MGFAPTGQSRPGDPILTRRLHSRASEGMLYLGCACHVDRDQQLAGESRAPPSLRDDSEFPIKPVGGQPSLPKVSGASARFLHGHHLGIHSTTLRDPTILELAVRTEAELPVILSSDRSMHDTHSRMTRFTCDTGAISGKTSHHMNDNDPAGQLLGEIR